MHMLMKCGHSAQGVDEAGRPACVICAGIDAGATEIAEEVPNLDGRQACCSDCGNTRESEFGLAFFEYRPKAQHDKYYCGCYGWD